jgi:lipopolysaccharide/colanic/teichoic acid biosynthesis glycosyltransferase
MKRVFDFLVAFIGLLITSPLLLLVMLAIWLQDGQSPFYIAPRVARGGSVFRRRRGRPHGVSSRECAVQPLAQ